MSIEYPLHIFVVDDERMIAETLAVILERSGFQVSAFTNPLEALSSVSLSAPDLLISDVMMPQLSGIDLAIQVRQLRPSCKVLLFSGQAATADLLNEAHLEGHDFELLSKPIHPKDLIKKIREQPKGHTKHSEDIPRMIMPTKVFDSSVEG